LRFWSEFTGVILLAVVSACMPGCAADRSAKATKSLDNVSPVATTPALPSIASAPMIRLPPVHSESAEPALLAGHQRVASISTLAPPVALSPATSSGHVQLASAHEPLPSPSVESKPGSGRSLLNAPTVQAAPVPEEVPGPSVQAFGPSDVRDVTMANILASVSGRNPQVGYATERYAEAYARLIAARVLWLPSINAGVGWNNHSGPLQDTAGIVRPISRSSLTAGLGVQTIGAGSPVVPGLFANFHSADAIFQPKIANRAAAARDAAVRTTINDLLLDTALAYLDLLRAYQLHAITVDIRFRAEELAKATADFARTGEGTEADADRAATELAIRRNDVVRAEEEIQVASARVVELLNDDPNVALRPMEPAIAPVELVPLDTPIQTLLPTGLTNRPELAEAGHLVGEAVHRYRLEKTAPWLPNVLMGTSYAAFGGAPGGQIANTGGRYDMDAIAYWQVRGLGVGQYAARREARAMYDQKRFAQMRVMNEVAREIVQAHAQVQARHRQIAISQQAVERATGSIDRNLLRVRDLKGLPIETLQSIQALDHARREYLRALVDYNTAQFRLQRALGWPIQLSDGAPAQGKSSADAKE
jgi:outer membrane protein TolC